MGAGADDAVGVAFDGETFFVEVRAEVVDRFAERLAQTVLHLVRPLAGVDLAQQVGLLGVEALERELEELLHAVDLDAVEEAGGSGEH